MIGELLKLSKIFKQGFTIELKEGRINQYTNYDKPYIASYEILITICPSLTSYFNIDNIPSNCIIGGWHDSNFTYYIELNKAFKDKNEALIFAIQHNQKCIYDIRTSKTINEYRGIKL